MASDPTEKIKHDLIEEYLENSNSNLKNSPVSPLHNNNNILFKEDVKPLTNKEIENEVINEEEKFQCSSSSNENSSTEESGSNLINHNEMQQSKGTKTPKSLINNNSIFIFENIDNELNVSNENKGDHYNKVKNKLKRKYGHNNNADDSNKLDSLEILSPQCKSNEVEAKPNLVSHFSCQ